MVIHNDKLFLVKGGIECLNKDTGESLWSSADIGTSCKEAGIYDNTLFISGNCLFAIDIDTHQVIWKYSKGGDLRRINEGIIYIGD